MTKGILINYLIRELGKSREEAEKIACIYSYSYLTAKQLNQLNRSLAFK